MLRCVSFDALIAVVLERDARVRQRLRYEVRLDDWRDEQYRSMIRRRSKIGSASPQFTCSYHGNALLHRYPLDLGPNQCFELA